MEIMALGLMYLARPRTLQFGHEIEHFALDARMLAGAPGVLCYYAWCAVGDGVVVVVVLTIPVHIQACHCPSSTLPAPANTTNPSIQRSIQPQPYRHSSPRCAQLPPATTHSSARHVSHNVTVRRVLQPKPACRPWPSTWPSQPRANRHRADGNPGRWSPIAPLRGQTQTQTQTQPHPHATRSPVLLFQQAVRACSALQGELVGQASKQPVRRSLWQPLPSG
ncbi:hypothetical protein DFH27DRAFT_527985 [Peziza echinospora]|nr:hypothetical protein DFH27DRAFT_527985 [Peziza echinospora]